MIRILPESLVNRIAAGEVIVRPASVVKELVENSIDAGATRITVEIANGCRDISVRDDGGGIERGDALLALVRHATSKITTFDDLYDLSTRGFRGEALASIASVSRMQVLTRRPADIAGTRVLADGAGEPRMEAAGAPEGTEVRVRELFYNTPARLKFLKNPTAELHQVLATITRQALIRPELGWTVIAERGTLLDLPTAQPWNERVAAVLGSNILENLLQVDDHRHSLHVRGFVVRPAATRKDRRQQFFFVNGRPVSSRSLSFVLQDAYKGIIMVQRYPICVLDLVIPSGEVDVNVHPTKEEVRFRNESMVNGVVHRVVHARLQAANLLPEANLGGDDPLALSMAQAIQAGASTAMQADMVPQMWPPAAPKSNASTSPFDFRSFTAGAQTTFVAPSSPYQKQAAQVAAAEAELQAVSSMASSLPPDDDTDTALANTSEQDEGTECSVRPITNSLKRLPETVETATAYALMRNGMYPEPLGQVSRCYIVAQTGHDMLLIDQHAAHERLLYLKFSAHGQATPSQPLLLPVSVDIPASAIPYMHRLMPVFENLGLQVEEFGGQTYMVHSIPADLPNLDAANVVADLLDDFETLGKVEQVEILRDRIITRMACRAAVKAGQILHHEEMRALIRDIANARLGFTCPHGRPTMILLTRDQLDKQFKRKV